MAIGLLIQSNQILPTDIDLNSFGFIGELSLNGKIRPCTGVLPMVIAAKKAGIKSIILPLENAQEACLVKGIEAYGFGDLQSIIDFIEGRGEANLVIDDGSLEIKPNYPIDFSDVKGQDVLIEYIVVAAAGGHDMLMVGTPG